ncbi:MAG: ATP-binding cassette domain-containing protein [Candidatus Lokiarchaeota archaeon]|nr:ATP-binding cassette domain-containing protein [Candidatus Lokiarchaeota archaeon]
MEDFIEVNNLTKKYLLSNGKEIVALDDINLKVKKGEILGIFGKSGAGKTSLIRILRGVEPFNEGSVKINDVKLLANDQTSKKVIHKLKRFSAIHLQRSFGLWADSVLHNVMRRLNVIKHGSEVMDLPAEESSDYKELKKMAIKILEIVGLDHKAEWFSGVLSGGEKQRLVLARQMALIGYGLDLLLLDEPVTMSDPDLKQVSLDRLKKLVKEHNITTLVTSHIPDILENICDRIVILDKGLIKKIISPEGFISEYKKDMQPTIKLEPLGEKKKILSGNDVLVRYYHLNLKKAFALEIEKLNLYQGEILGILGHSGIGKTVLLRTLAGVEKPKEGKILFFPDEGDPIDIYDLGYDAMNVRMRISYMHQELDLGFFSNVKDLILSKLGLKGESAIRKARKKAKKLGIKEEYVDIIHRIGDLPYYEISSRLEKLDLDPQIVRDLFPLPPLEAYEDLIIPLLEKLDLDINILERKTKELSGGEKIRIALLLQIFSKPKLLLLDEPFGDLDPYTLRNITNFLKELNREMDITIVIATHHYRFMKECVHRIIKIDEKEKYSTLGRIGTTKEEINEICDDFSTKMF